MGSVLELVREEVNALPGYQQGAIWTVVREIVQEFINAGMLYPGYPGDQNSSYPWLTITTYGREAFVAENWLPYDPEGYLKELTATVPALDDITLTYIGESISAFNHRQLLSATITLGVASENLMLLLIEAYVSWLADPRKTVLQKKIEDRWISTQYKEFKLELANDIKALPAEMRADWETYLDGIFNFIRLNRNSAGHPTGKELSAKVVYANLQIFAEYARYIHALIAFLKP